MTEYDNCASGKQPIKIYLLVLATCTCLLAHLGHIVVWLLFSKDCLLMKQKILYQDELIFLFPPCPYSFCAMLFNICICGSEPSF